MTTSLPLKSGRLLPYRSLLTGIVLMLAAWILYSPSLNYGFVYYDDVRILRDHPELYGQKTLAADLKAIFVTCYPREEPLPLRDVTWAIDSRLFGFGNAFGYHFGNVLLHGVVVALLFAFLLGATRRYSFALATTTLYLLLATHVEPVVWIMGRKDILSALFMLLALCAQTRRLDAKSLAAQVGWYFAVLVFLVAGLLSKISVLTFPAVLFLLGVFLPHLRGEQPANATFPWRRALREGLLLIPAFAFSGITYIWYRRILTQTGILDTGYTAHGLGHFWNLLMVDPLVFWIYLRQFFFPLHLSVFYGWLGLRSPYPLWQMVIGMVTTAVLIATGIWLFRRRKDLFFFFGSGLVLMIPYLNLVFVGIWVADRYVYFASFCAVAILVSLAGTAWLRAKSGLRQTASIIGAILVANNLFQTVSYQAQWRNAESLWQYHIALPQPEPKAYDNLGAFYFADFNDAASRQDTLRMEKALKKMTVVVNAGLEEFWPDHRQPPPPKTYFLFFLQSLIEEVTGKPDAALESLLISDKLRPRFDSTDFNLSRIYQELAGTTKDVHQREIYLKSARDRFAEYIKLAYRVGLPPPEVRQEMTDLEAKCLAVKQATAQPEETKPPQ
jgi:hypothetical protein